MRLALDAQMFFATASVYELPDIAASLVISEETVKTHVKRVMSKLDLTSRAQAVVFAYESGLVVAGGRSV